MASWARRTSTRPTIRPSMPRQCAFYVVTTLLVVSMLEGVFYGLLWFIPDHWYYTPPTRKVFLHYLASAIDWEFGWRPEPHELSAAGYRHAPAGAGLATPCIALYGDSFTFGYESPQNMPGGISSPSAWAVVSIITVLLVLVQTRPICISNIITSMDLTKHQ